MVAAKYKKAVTIPLTTPCCWCEKPTQIRLCRTLVGEGPAAAGPTDDFEEGDSQGEK